MAKNYKYRTYSAHGNYRTNCLLSAILNFIAMLPAFILMMIFVGISKILSPLYRSDLKKENKDIDENKKESQSHKINLSKKEKIKIINNKEKKKKAKKVVLCPKCSSLMILRSGPYGKFYGCSKYPRCAGKIKLFYK